MGGWIKAESVEYLGTNFKLCVKVPDYRFIDKAALTTEGFIEMEREFNEIFRDETKRQVPYDLMSLAKSNNIKNQFEINEAKCVI